MKEYDRVSPGADALFPRPKGPNQSRVVRGFGLIAALYFPGQPRIGKASGASLIEESLSH